MADYEIIRPRKEGWLEKIKRSITLGPWNPRDPAIARYFGGSSVSSGVTVNEQTAMNYSAVWGAVTLISGSISILPLELYKRDLDGESKSKFRRHPLYRLLHDRANPQMGASMFRRTMQQNKLVWGNGYAEIERDQVGRPIALWPLLSYAMWPYVDNGVLQYRYQDPSGRTIEFGPMDIVHLRGPSEDGICGMSAIRAGRESIGIGIAAERFAGAMFKNGLNVGGIISYPQGVSPSDQVKDETRNKLEKMHAGVENAHRFLALYQGAKFEKFNIQPDDAQFLESRIFQVEEICRWFNIPPHKLKDLANATYSNIEQQNLEYLTDALEPHLNEWEEELTLKLISPLEQTQQLIEFTRGAYLKADSASRATLQSQQFQVGLLTPNEGRALENRNPIPSGDIAFVPLTHIPIDMARDYWSAHIEATKAPKEAPKPFPGNQPPPETKDDGELIEARKRAQDAEEKRDLTLAEAKDERAKHEAERQMLSMEVVNGTKHVLDWRSWAQLIFLGGGPVTLDDDAMRAAVCAEYDKEINALKDARFRDVNLEQIAHAETRTALDAEKQAHENIKQEHARVKEWGDKCFAEVGALGKAKDAALADIERLMSEREIALDDFAQTAHALASEWESHALTCQKWDIDVEELERTNIAKRETESQRDAALADVERLIAERDTIKAHDAMVEADYQRVCEERDARIEPLSRSDDPEESEAVRLTADYVLMTRKAWEQEANVGTRQRDTLQTERDNAKMKLGETENALNVATLRISTLEGDVSRLEAGALSQREQLTELAQREKDATQHTEALSADVEMLKTDLARARADIATELDRQKTQKATLLAAMRSLFVDATERLLYRETERARKNQQTPDKLRSWAERFYDMHAEHVRQAFQPLVGPWTAITGGAPGTLLDRLVDEHITTSRRGLQAVLEQEDPDEIAANLERTLMRWEKERADAMADALVREGMVQ